MNTPSDAAVKAVLLVLWRARQEISMQQVLAASGRSPNEIQGALGLLEERGCRIERSPTGVVLREAALSCWCDILEGEAQACGRVLGRRVKVYFSTTSTNDVALHHADDPDAEGLVVLADEQSAGRGRLGRGWTAQAGQSVLMSLLVPGVGVAGGDAMNRLTLLAGLAAAEGLERVFDASGQPGRTVEIKWPNDLLVDGRKVAGILVECRAGGGVAGGAGGAVVGIGVNVTQGAGDFPEELAGRATSLRLVGAAGGGSGAGAENVDRLLVIDALLDSFERHFAGIDGDDAPWLGEWKRRCNLLGRRITVQSQGQRVTGYGVDISPLQGLIVKDDAGVMRFFSAQLSSLA